MDFYSPNLSKTHFLAVAPGKQGLSSLDKVLFDVYFAIDDRKNVLAITEKLGLKMYKIRQSIESLWKQGLVVQVEVLDESYLQLLKLSFARILGGGADGIIEKVASKSGLDVSEIPVSRIEKFVGELADEISDFETREKFIGFMLRMAPGFSEFKDKNWKPVPEKSDFKIVNEQASVQSELDGGKKGDSGPGRSKGKIRELLDRIIARRSKGNVQAADALKVKLALKGINPEHFSTDTADDPALLKRVQSMAKEFGVSANTDQEPSVGKIKLIIDSIITQRSGGNPAIARAIKTKLVLKGINPDYYSLEMPDNPGVLEKVKNLAHSYGVSVGGSKSRSFGKVKLILDAIITQKSKGDPVAAMSIKKKFVAKGVDPDRYGYTTPDHPILLKKLETLAANIGVRFETDNRTSEPEDSKEA
jgi:hypothetical protein